MSLKGGEVDGDKSRSRRQALVHRLLTVDMASSHRARHIRMPIMPFETKVKGVIVKVVRVDYNQDVVHCPRCGAYYLVTDLEDGEHYRCSSCGKVFEPAQHIEVHGYY